MLRYRSESVRSLNLYFVWPALLTGYMDEKQWVHVELLDDFLDDPLQPAVRLDFQVRPCHFGTISLPNHATFPSQFWLVLYSG